MVGSPSGHWRQWVTSAQRHDRAIELFHQACDLSGGERSTFLSQACGGDEELRRDVESLLRYDSEVGGAVEAAEAGEGIRALSVIVLGEAESAPSRIGDFRIIREIGHGGMGVVYEAQQDHPHRTVALKVLHAGVGAEDVLRRFRREVDLLGRFQHPAIAQVFEAGVGAVVSEDGSTGKKPFFVMELIDGQPLDKYARTQNLDDRARLSVFATVCDGVQHAHDRGVIHRDLKPANILVTAAGQPKILDFGVSRATDADVNTVTLRTEAGQLVGTIPYMSPEQVLGDPAALDERSDVYSLGVVLFELLARRLPHDLKNRPIPEAVRIIREDEPTLLGSVEKRLRGDLETIVAKALEKDRNRRYGSAAELGADIRRFLNDDPIVARPASAIYQLGKFARRHRGVAAGICVAALALIGGSAVAIWQGLEARSAQRIAERRFADLQGFAHSVILDYPKLQDMKGETQAREFLTKTTLKYLDGMARDTRGLDMKILEDLALAYSATGDLLGRPNAPNLGDPKASLKSYQKSAALFDDLVARDPDNIEFKRSLAITCERIGNLYLQDQAYDQALDIVRKAHDLKLAVSHKHDLGPRDLSFSFSKLGDVYIKMGRFEEAYDMYVRSLNIRKQLADAKAEDGEIQRAYTVGLNRVADVLLELHRNAEALELVQASLRRRVDRATSQADSLQAALDLGNGHLKLAQVLARVGRLDEALRSFESARTVLRGLAETDPSNSTARTGCAEVSGEMGRVLLEAGRFDAALPQLTAYTQEMERSMPEDAMTAGIREQLASGHHRRAQALMALARSPQATTEQIQQHKAEGCTALRRAAQLYESLDDGGGRVPPELEGELEECAKQIDAG